MGSPTEPGAEMESAAAGASYEQCRAELEQVVHRLEAGGLALEEALALWERGEWLARQCQDWLDGARRRLAKVQAEASARTEDEDAAGSG